MDKASVDLAIERAIAVAADLGKAEAKHADRVSALTAQFERDTAGVLWRLGDALRPALRVKGAPAESNVNRLTQGEVAKLVGVSQSTVNRAAKLRANFANVTQARDAFAAYGGTLSEWMGFVGADVTADEYHAEVAARREASAAAAADRASKGKALAEWSATHPVESVIRQVMDWPDDQLAALVESLSALIGKPHGTMVGVDATVEPLAMVA